MCEHVVDSMFRSNKPVCSTLLFATEPGTALFDRIGASCQRETPQMNGSLRKQDRKNRTSCDNSFD